MRRVPEHRRRDPRREGRGVVRPFAYLRAADEAAALDAARDPDARFLAGGTTLVDLMRLEVMRPTTVVDIRGLPLAAIAPNGDGGWRVGALASMTDVVAHAQVTGRFPALAEALLAGASPQIRNMATLGGNILQRTRCPYFRDLATPCNKRAPQSGCSAIGGYTRSHAVLGASPQCIATHPSDLAVALVALDAIVHTRGDSGERAIPIVDFHTLPGDHPEIESVLHPGELVVAIELPARPFAKRSTYVKVRDRASFAFALASAAVALDVDGGAIRDARVALGGVATKPWRSAEAERALLGKRPSRALFADAAAAALADARPTRDNAFKVALARRAIERALAKIGGIA
jgi:xanthine dehydrogenase YagS FAD-binding subunit